MKRLHRVFTLAIFTPLAAVALIATSALTALSLSSQAPTNTAVQAKSNGQAIGLVVRFSDSVDSGKVASAFANRQNLLLGDAVGQNAVAFKFKADRTEAEAKSLADTLGVEPNVAGVYIDHFIAEAKFLAPANGIHWAGPKSAVLRSASAPLSMALVDMWNSATPMNPIAKLSWKPPTNLFGARILGYRIDSYDPASKTWSTVVENTQSTTTTFIFNQGLTAGVPLRLRVAAIAYVGSTAKVGSYGSSVVIVPTAVPQSPVFANGSTVTSIAPSIAWIAQSPAQKGGLPVTYTATASASGQPNVNCTTTNIRCKFAGLSPNVTYSVSLTATNAHGYASALSVVGVQDVYYSKQWYLGSNYGVNAQAAWSITQGNPSKVVAVIDTGITNHPDLKDNVITGYDMISDPANAGDGNGRDADPTDVGDYTPGNSSSWHGTHVAGIIAAEANSIGIIGVAPKVSIEPIRVLGKTGGSESDIAAAINWAIGLKVGTLPINRNPAKIINLSIGSNSYQDCTSYSPTQLAITAAVKANVTMLTAAGNNNNYAAASYPGNCYGNITVGASNYSGDRAYYSNFGYLTKKDGYVGVDISAPGGDDQDSVIPNGGTVPAGGEIYSTLNDGKTVQGNPTYGAEEGTSMASPVAAGVVALMYSVKPNLTDDQIWQILKTTATPFANGTECASLPGYCGIGIVNAGAAVAAVVALH
jgi:serine protease